MIIRSARPSKILVYPSRQEWGNRDGKQEFGEGIKNVSWERLSFTSSSPGELDKVILTSSLSSFA